MVDSLDLRWMLASQKGTTKENENTAIILSIMYVRTVCSVYMYFKWISSIGAGGVV